MSKLYEAVQRHAETARPVSRTEVLRAVPARITDSRRREMKSLAHALEAVSPHDKGAIVLFTASRPREGTTTVVCEFARAVVSLFGASVMVVDADPKKGSAKALGETQAQALTDYLRALPTNGVEAAKPGVTVAVWDINSLSAAIDEDDAAVLAQIGMLRERYDYTIFDVPSITEYPIAVSIGNHVDGVVMVVEAERTRWPVIENTKRAYEAIGAKVIGVVLNKRRFYIPRWVYKWM